jgi:hypothetical protein
MVFDLIWFDLWLEYHHELFFLSFAAHQTQNLLVGEIIVLLLSNEFQGMEPL